MSESFFSLKGLGSELPRKATKGSAAFDLRSVLHLTIRSGKWASVPTGLGWNLDEATCPFRVGYGLVCPRSGLALNSGITVLNAPGVIDADFPGEICVLLLNVSDRDYIVSKGERIAQLIVHRKEEWMDDTDSAPLRVGGFGSTDV